MNNDQTTASGPAASTQRPAREIAAEILGEITWTSDKVGYCECPGKRAHSSKDNAKDCVVFLDRIPTINCFHTGCKTALEIANKRLRSAILNPDGKPNFNAKKLTSEQRAIIRERETKARLQLRARKALPTILKKFRWPFEEILCDSPVNLKGNKAEHWKLLLGKFKSDDVVWIGERDHSGPQYANHFKTAADWLKGTEAPYPFICPAAFKNNVSSRSNANVLERRFVVVESDELTRDEVGAVFRYLVNCGMELVAIVDTAGKSLHGWFKYPGDEEMEDLHLLLPALKCDPKMLTASQPARLPGAMRGEKRQQLIFLKAEENY